MLIYNFNNWWEWENPQKVTFDPINKYIIINSGETSIDVQIDMYSAWKEWIVQGGNAQWDAAFRTFGGDRTGENQFAPRYYFLINGWKVVANNIECVVQTNLYSDDGDSPFIIDNAAITNRASDVPVVQSEVERRLEYGDRIYFDATSSYIGTSYPNGTIAQPVNNIPDAIALATLYNITNFYILSNVDILDTGNVFENYTIIADRENLTINIVDGNYLNNMEWVGFNMDGYFGGGNNKFVDCIIENIYDVSGHMKSCQINGNIRVWDSMVASLCYSGVAGSGTPYWDMNSDRTTILSVRSYSGGVELLNCNNSGDTTTIELIAGQIKLDPTCTDGYIDLRGVGYLTDNSSGSTVKTTGFIDSFENYIEETRATDQRLAYGQAIYYDENSIYTGITYPVGTIAQPVNNVIDLLTMSSIYNISNFNTLSDVTSLGTGNTFENYTIYGAKENLTIYSGDNYVNNVLTKNLSVISNTTILTGGTRNIVNCTILELTGFIGVIENSKLVGNIEFVNDSDVVNCYSGDKLTTEIREVPQVYLSSLSGIYLDFRNYSGDLELTKVQHVNDYIVIDVNSGKIVITSGCTAGYIEIRGVGQLIDNSSSGCTINSTGFVNSFDIFLEEINTEIQSSAFENGVWIDISGVTGTTYPIGTQLRPVNNVEDAIIIANGRGFDKLFFNSNYTFDNSINISDFDLIGRGPLETLFKFETGCILANCLTSNATLSGLSFGITTIKDSFLINYGSSGLIASNSDVSISNSRIEGEIIIPSNYTGTLTLIDCQSLGTSISGRNNVYLNNAGCEILLRNHTGTVHIYETNNPNTYVSVDMISGRITLEPSITEGKFNLRGVGTLENLAGPNIILDTESFINQDSISTAVWDEDVGTHLIAGSTGRVIGDIKYNGMVHIDAVNGTTGTTFPVGSTIEPVNNLADAITIAEENGFETLRIEGDFTFESTDYISNYIIVGDGIKNATFTFVSGATIFNCSVSEALVTGDVKGVTEFSVCDINNLNIVDIASDREIIIKNCLLQDHMSIPAGFTGEFVFLDSWAGTITPVFDFNGAECNVFIRRYSGGITVEDMSNPLSNMELDINEGHVILDSSNTDGNILINGTGLLTDNSNGTVVNSDGLINRENIAIGVWDENIGDHLISGSAGRVIGNIQFNSKVTLKSDGFSGTTFPIGTERVPVNNLSDAKLIAEANGIETLLFEDDWTIESGESIDSFSITMLNEKILTLESGCTTNDTYFYEHLIRGVLNGHVHLERNIIHSDGISEFYGYMIDVVMSGNITISSDTTKNAVFIDLKTGDVPEPPHINCNGDGAKLSLRGLTGAALITNKTGASNSIFIDLYSARIGFDSTVTAGNITVRGSGYIYLDESTNTTFNTEGLMSKETVSEAVWDENIGDHLLEGSSGRVIALSQFNGFVHIDPASSNTGTTFPVGTDTVPVNNLTDAKQIAQNNGFGILNIVSNLTILSGESVNTLTIQSNNHSTVNIEEGASTLYTNFKDVNLKGTLNGYTIITKGTVDSSGLNEFYGTMEETIFNGALKISSDNTKDAVIIDIHSGSINGPAILDLNGDGAKLSLRGMTGAFLIQNKTGSTKPAFIDIYSGRIGFDSSNTAGNFTLRGIGNIYLNESTNTTFDTEGLMSQPTVAEAVWDEKLATHTIDGTTGRALALHLFDGKVWLDPTSSYSGTTYPIGTQGVPVNNGSDAVIIAERENITEFYLSGIFTSTQNISGVTIAGESVLEDGLILDNTEYHGVTFKNIYLSGTANFTHCEFIDCVFSNIHGLVGNLTNCNFLDNTPITLASGQTLFNNCRSQVAGNNSPTFDCAAGNIDLSVRAYSGGIKFLNYDDPNNISTVEFVAGRLNLTNTCTDGFISARGVYSIGGLDLVGPSFTLDTDARAATVDGVWDETITNHLNPNSTGDALYNVSAGADPNIIANTVWNTQLSAYTAEGSAGSSLGDVTLATSGLTDMTEMKADIKRILGLTQENFRITDHVYTGDNLDSAKIKIFNNSSDCDNNVNPLETYYMVALYDSSGKLIDYKVTRS